MNISSVDLLARQVRFGGLVLIIEMALVHLRFQANEFCFKVRVGSLCRYSKRYLRTAANLQLQMTASRHWIEIMKQSDMSHPPPHKLVIVFINFFTDQMLR